MNRQYKIISFTAKQIMEAGYSGPMGGALSGTHYAIYEDGKGFCSLDGGRTVYMLTGKMGRKSLQDIIDAGGFVGEIGYRQTI